MKLWKYIVAIIILVSVWTPVRADESVADSTATESELNVQEVIFGHTGDSYEWHLTNIGDKAISIPLPVIAPSANEHCSFACSGVWMPNPTAHGRSVTSRTFSMISRLSVRMLSRVPVTPSDETM